MGAKIIAGIHDTVLVVDFGAQYAQLIARRVREAQVYSEIVPHRITAAEVAAKAPKAIILSGGPKSVHVDGAPILDPAIYELGIPILGICYGCQLVAQQLGGVVDRGGRGEYGRATLTRSTAASTLLGESTPQVHDVWMSHFDFVSELPAGFTNSAATPDAPNAVIENNERRIFGVQYHPEVVHTSSGQDLLVRFRLTLLGVHRTGQWQALSMIRLQLSENKWVLNAQSVVCRVVSTHQLQPPLFTKQLVHNSHVSM